MGAQEGLDRAREQVLQRLLLGFALSIGLAALIMGPMLLAHDRLTDLVVGLALSAALAAIRAASWKHRTKAVSLLGTLMGAATISLYFEGLAMAPTLVGFAVPFFAILFLGLRAAIACFAWWLLVVAGIGSCLDAGILHLTPNPTHLRVDPGHWPFLAVAQVVVGAPIVYAAHLIITRLTAALQHESCALEELRAAQERIAASERLKALGMLAGGIAHDLNNTLTVISGEVELSDGLSEPTRDSILQALDSASQLASQMLLSSGRMIAQRRQLDLYEALQPQLTAIKRIFPEKIEVRMVAPAAPLPVFVDLAMLRQAVLNLAINAKDAMPNGGELTFEFLAPTDSEDPRAALRVQDSGHGMTAEVLQHATEPFFTTKSEGQGTGLGLANVREAVSANGGELQLDSHPGRGTSVTLSFPVSEGAQPRFSDSYVLRRKGGSLLLVEDNLRLRALAAEALTQEGYEVYSAGTVAEAKQIVASLKRLDVLVSDLVLPDGSGVELARESSQRFEAMRVIVMSGYAPTAEARAALRAGEFSMLPKPFRIRQLLSAVAAARQPVHLEPAVTAARA